MRHLVANNLYVRLGDRTILNGISLDLKSGELVGLLGPNASGKTTLLRALSNLIMPDRGTILLDEKSITKHTPHERARRLAYLEQGATTEWPISVERLVGLGRAPHIGLWSRPTAEDKAAVIHAMERCNVAHLSKRAANAISSGERARVMLARALVTGASTLLADEPISNLDPYHQLRVMELIRKHTDDCGAAITALHDLTLAARFCDRIILLLNGKIAASGAPKQILTAENLARVFSIDASIIEQGGELHVLQHTAIEKTKARLGNGTP
jgi:ABC-type cobalamin/Fe3+-siderophores transport system ATPase subunit